MTMIRLHHDRGPAHGLLLQTQTIFVINASVPSSGSPLPCCCIVNLKSPNGRGGTGGINDNLHESGRGAQEDREPYHVRICSTLLDKCLLMMSYVFFIGFNNKGQRNLGV